jgi:hypothetical protein
MGGRSVDCHVLHAIPALLGAFLALSTGIAGQQDSAARRSLPGIKQLLSDARDNQKQVDSLVDQYSCTETEEVRVRSRSVTRGRSCGCAACYA